MALNVGQLVATLRLDDAQYNGRLEQDRSKWSKFATFLGTTAKAAGTAAAGGVLVAGAAIGASVDKAGQFEKSMRLVGTTLGETGQGLESLTALATKMGAETTFSAQGASDAMVELAKGGLTAAEIKAGALQQTLTLATAGGLELGAASTYMVQGLTTFGLKAEDATQVAAALAGGANASTASVESMGQALSQVGPGAKTAGLSIQETTAALAAFDNAGIKGNDAGTSLKTMLTRLVPQTDKAANAMKALGLDFTDAQGNMLPLHEIAGQLQGSFSKLSQEQRTSALATIFGSDATRAASVLADQGAAGIQKLTKATSDQSAAQALASNATKGYAGAMEAFKGGLETIQIQLGTKFLPILTTGLGFLSTRVLPQVSVGIESASRFVGQFSAGFTKAGDGVAYFGTNTERYGAIAHEWLWKIKQAVRDMFPPGSGAETATTLERLQAKAVALWPYLVQIKDSLGALHPVLQLAGAMAGFFADHIDTIISLMPLIVAAFVAYKAAQTAATIASIIQLPITLALAASNIAYANAVWALLAAMGVERTSRLASLVLWIRHAAFMTVATVRVYAYVAGVYAMELATKGMALAQRLLNAVMSANPFVKVAMLIGVLAAGVIYAYKHSETFRRIVDGAFRAVAAAGSFMWNEVLKPVFRTLLSVWLTAADGIIGAASKVARALGMDGLADKLDAAKGELSAFKDSAMRSLDIPDETVTVTALGKLVLPAGFTSRDAASFARRDAAMANRRAEGGPIKGPGTGTSDSIPAVGPGGAAYALSDDEWIIRQRSARKYGYAAMAAVNEGTADIIMRAGGGPILSVRAAGRTGNMREGARDLTDRQAAQMRNLGQYAINGAAAAAVRGYNASLAAIGDEGGPSTPNGQGGLGPAARRASAAVRTYFGFTGTIGGYANRNIAGTNTPSKHKAGKAIDVMTYSNMALGQRIANYFLALRGQFGVDNIIFNRRITNRGRGWQWGYYGGVSPHTDHPHIDFFDKGGRAVGPGWMKKATLRPERVLSPRQTESYERHVDLLDRPGRAAEPITLSRESVLDLALALGSRPVVLKLDGEQLARHQDRRLGRKLSAAGL